MMRLTLGVLGAWLTLTDFVSAQLVIRAPFVRVEVGGPGVYVRAPFVNLAIPTAPSYYYESPPAFVGPPPAPQGEAIAPPTKKTPPPPAPAKPKLDPPEPMQAAAPTLEEFAKSFQPKAGNYEVTLVNPVTQQPTVVRFTLPEGTPRRVHASRQGIEFDYGPRRYIKIQFDRDGAEITTRGL